MYYLTYLAEQIIKKSTLKQTIGIDAHPMTYSNFLILVYWFSISY